MINWAIRHEIKPFLQSLHNQKILDFGCGDQRYKKYINNSNKYYGMDVISKHGGDKKQIFEYEFDTKNNIINFESNFFDTIIFTEVLEHLQDFDLIISELYRVLKKKGKIFITTPFMWAEHQVPFDFQRFTSFGIEALFLKKGFKIIAKKKLIKGKFAIFQIVESEITKYINSNNSFKFIKLINFLKCKFLIFLLKIIFIIMVNNNPFSNIYINNHLICSKE
jgi:ubiquinone/menaquinone biosynthesis C-methylase UbiE